MPFSEEFITHKRRGTSNLAPADTITFHSGDVLWVPSVDHWTSVTSYEARVRAEGSSTVLASLNVGKPTPHPTTGKCYANISAILSGLSAGNYTASIAATSAGGTTDSADSTAFSLPLA